MHADAINGCYPVLRHVFDIAIAHADVEMTAFDGGVQLIEERWRQDVIGIEEDICEIVFLDIDCFPHLFKEIVEGIAFSSVLGVVSLINEASLLPCYFGCFVVLATIVGDDIYIYQFLRIVLASYRIDEIADYFLFVTGGKNESVSIFLLLIWEFLSLCE